MMRIKRASAGTTAMSEAVGRCDDVCFNTLCPLDTSRFVLDVISFLSAGLPGTVRLGRLQGPPNANALLSFHKPLTGNLAASAATGAESALNVVPQRNQHMQPATQAASSEVRGSGGVPPLHTSIHPFACSLQSVCSAFYRLILSSHWCCRSG